MYAFRTTHGPVDLAFTDRYGGVSAVPYDELDLALEGGDDPAARAANHRILLADFAPDDTLAGLRQVHGNQVVDALQAAAAAEPPTADGVVTTSAGTTLIVRAADCVPVLLADARVGVIGAAHCGRPGLVAGVVPATLAALRASGAAEITAWVGPYVCGACYEVPEELQAEVAATEPAALSRTSWGTPALDIGAGVRAQLEREHVRVVDACRCTRESADLYSYRRDGVHAGRHAGIIRLRR